LQGRKEKLILPKALIDKALQQTTNAADEKAAERPKQ